MRPLGIEGAWVDDPRVHSDRRGRFHEWFKAGPFHELTGHRLELEQANCSRSSLGTLRGIHCAAVPPGQGKYVTCVGGAVLDVVVDLRTGSPTFGAWEAVRLDDREHRAVYLSEGLGHAFMALEEGSVVVYLCSQGYAPEREFGIHPFDPELAIDWPADLVPELSEKDAAAPTLAEARGLGLLPSYEECVAYRRRLGSGTRGETCVSW
ncbi:MULTISPECIES: dTDP-4-dehydrorhamnose 3,5-epimerase family protein [Streptomyces]|uniref:dTDP-4-keto-6-deoxy-D-glucose epimerase n=1 Tax=Streptomyces tsukubensis (strain DSM 42081 / NBRC 108919 / NRRL 18488 / 9993) TaxID=1114943 RepID=I2N827_STRT9|nr:MULTISPECIES: dTDP-4-dehydrorhamnose 3,5-epimerase [Streptomyces]AZK96996.1 dTDP-4-dehydrorhamnose 3,5-epimerase [Streptomyces tsukubensis]EIF93174.1 dTDP-4-dehydrorhamnose 3,5-epimerase [Streptomyces tsukubensis NRRL18488]MYS66569.1 dTDP-4-dehydrorhamnose 3,5-epimerase [Streptomyces sp. SID5473]QKM67023.1 dTDP-4-keto-6-deoxy-D-glucose epimerase [Streptomyces tsukubensis NRRL18488]TAI41498.1 dTDP-4-keto-6-deoxy-D-glucose epimerase [Streptomyces tsukubensis]